MSAQVHRRSTLRRAIDRGSLFKPDEEAPKTIKNRLGQQKPFSNSQTTMERRPNDLVVEDNLTVCAGTQSVVTVTVTADNLVFGNAISSAIEINKSFGA